MVLPPAHGGSPAPTGGKQSCLAVQSAARHRPRRRYRSDRPQEISSHPSARRTGRTPHEMGAWGGGQACTGPGGPADARRKLAPWAASTARPAPRSAGGRRCSVLPVPRWGPAIVAREARERGCPRPGTRVWAFPGGTPQLRLTSAVKLGLATPGHSGPLAGPAGRTFQAGCESPLRLQSATAPPASSSSPSAPRATPAVSPGGSKLKRTSCRPEARGTA